MRKKRLALAAGVTALAVSVGLVAFVPPASSAGATTGQGKGNACVTPPLPPAGAPLVVDPATVAAPAGAGHPADRQEAAAVRKGIDNFIACIDTGDHRTASTLFTPRFVRDYMGQQSYDQVPSILGGLRIQNFRLDGITAYADGSFVTEGRYLAYGHALVHERQYWWPENGILRLNWVDTLPPEIPRHATRTTVEMGEYFFHLPSTRICAPAGNLVLDLRNVGAERHEGILLQLPPGADPSGLFDGTLSEDQVTTIGQGPGEGPLSLTRVRPGTYTLVDFIPAPDGRPHAMHGQVTQFAVERSGPACRSNG